MNIEDQFNSISRLLCGGISVHALCTVQRQWPFRQSRHRPTSLLAFSMSCKLELPKASLYFLSLSLYLFSNASLLLYYYYHCQNNFVVRPSLDPSLGIVTPSTFFRRFTVASLLWDGGSDYAWSLPCNSSDIHSTRPLWSYPGPSSWASALLFWTAVLDASVVFIMSMAPSGVSLMTLILVKLCASLI